jgi:pyrroline-5-carboxylate reductase
MTAALPRTLVLIGAGKMGGAMLEGWLAGGLDAGGLVVLDPHASADLSKLARARGFRLNPPPAEIMAPEALVLGIKPQSLDGAAPILSGLAAPGTLLVSILAGKTLADLAARAPRARAIVRAMPNLPAAVRRGITGLVASPETTPEERRMAGALLGGIGQVEWLEDEALIDAVTAVSGSGPAYVFLMVEALASAGRAAGLPDGVALRLARATVEGAGELLHRSPAGADELRRNVTSPGGTTAAALEVLMGPDGLEPLMTRAVAAARARAQALSG